jgi:hypothetical protein
VKNVGLEILAELHVFTPSPRLRNAVFDMLFVGVDEDLTTA